MNSLLLVAALAAPGPLANIAVERSMPLPLRGTLVDAPVVPAWQPGDPIRLVPRRHADDPLLNAVPTPVNPSLPVTTAEADKGTASRAPGLPLIDIGTNDGAQLGCQFCTKSSSESNSGDTPLTCAGFPKGSK